MDFRAFRDTYITLPTLAERTAYLLAFAEASLQSCPDELIPLLEEACQSNSLEGRSAEAAGCRRVLGWIALHRGDYAQAQHQLEQARELVGLAGDEAGRIKVLNGLASVQAKQGRIEGALSLYRDALDLALRKSDRNEAQLIQARIGEALMDIDQVAEAEVFLSQALVPGGLSEVHEAEVRTKLAHVYRIQSRGDRAREFLLKAIALARQGRHLSALAAALDLAGHWATEDHQLQQAENALTEALLVARAAADRSTETQVMMHQAGLRLVQGRFEEAETLFGKGLERSHGIGSWLLEEEGWKGLAFARKARGRWREALEAFEQHLQARDRIRDEKATSQIAHIRADQTRREADLFRQQSRTLALLGDLGQRITATLDLESIVLAVYQSIGELMRAETFGLGLFDDSRGMIDYRLFIENGQRIAPYEAPADESSLSGWCVRHRQDVLMNDVEQEYHRYLPEPPRRFGDRGRPSRSVLFTPLIAEGHVLGVLSAQSDERNAYTDRDLATLKTLGSSISIAIQNARLFAQVTQMATIDSLTGACTRRHLFERTEEEFQRFRREGQPVSLVMIDLDHFKALNDNWGHATGDRVLTEFGKVCLAHKRPHDLFGRYGGEEFALVLTGTSLEGAQSSAQRLCERVRDLELLSPRGERLEVRASFGVTEFGQTDTDITKVFNRADEALYRAKLAGRDQVAVTKV